VIIWARKGGKPRGRFLVGSLLGVLGIFTLAAASRLAALLAAQ
jgi:hypothetical protein